MTQMIPVLFTTIDDSFVLPPGSAPEDAYESEEFNARLEAGEVWSDTSRNWWHVFLAFAMAEAQDLTALDFLRDEECITIAHSDLAAVIAALDQLLGTLDAPLPDDVDETIRHYGAIVSRPEFLSALPNISPDAKNDDGSDTAADMATRDREAALSFYRFLISLRSVARHATDQGQALLFVVPAP